MTPNSAWRNALLGDVTEIVSGGTPDASNPDNFSDTNGIPWITPADLSGYKAKQIGHGRRFLSNKGLASCSARMLPENTVLMSSRAPIGYVAIAKSPLATNQGFKSFVCGPELEPSFLYHYLRHARSLVEDMASGTTFKEINAKNAARIPIKFPDLESQRQIAGKLDQIAARLDDTRARLESIPTILKRFRMSVLAAACSGKLTESWRQSNSNITSSRQWLLEQAETRMARFMAQRARAIAEGQRAPRQLVIPAPLEEVGEFPSTWSVCHLATLFSIETGGTPSRKMTEYWDGGTIPWVKTGEVQNCDIVAAEEHITPLGLAESNAKVFPTDTLLIAMYGEGKTRGQVGWLKTPAATNQACAALINEDISQVARSYAYYFCLGQYQKLREDSVGGNQPNLNLDKIKTWEIPVPPPEEQAEIVRRVGAMFKQAELPPKFRLPRDGV
jgi:type I restriction enzyme S subunit